jgi:glycolate oxidase
MDRLARQVAELRSIIGDDVVLDTAIIESYRRDRCDLIDAGTPAAVVRATTVEAVVETMQWASRYGIPVVPRGAGTGLSGGAHALDGGIVLSLEKLSRIREIDDVAQVAVVEAGVITADIDRAAQEHGLFYPPDPGSFEMSTVGGNLATNAGGMRCVKYGVTRNSVLGLEAVLADGRVVRTGARTVKNVAGLDLTSLFIGSEGVLGVITSATLKLRPKPAGDVATFVATFPDLARAGRAVIDILATGGTPSMLELMDNATINAVEDHKRLDLDRSAAAMLIGQADGHNAIAEIDRMVARAEAAGADEVFATSDPLEADAIVVARRLAGVATMERGPCIIEDVGVPPHRIGEMLAAIEVLAADSGLEIATVGHAGDGNLHPVVMLPDLSEKSRALGLDVADRMSRAAIALGGTITGEHGVGVLKQRWLADQIDPVTRELSHAIKRALDPISILNPGRAI